VAFIMAITFYMLFIILTMCGRDVFQLKSQFQQMFGLCGIKEGRSCSSGWMGPVFGVWHSRALECFEVRERGKTFNVPPKKILQATTFSITLGLLAIPGLAIVAKLAEYANRVPWSIDGYTARPQHRILYGLHMAEFALLVVLSSAPLISGVLKAVGISLPLLATQILIVLRAAERAVEIAFFGIRAEGADRTPFLA